MRRRLGLLAVLLTLLHGSCALHSSATRFHGLIGHEGHPVHVKSTTNIGVNVLVFIPLFGATTIDRMIDSVTGAIAEDGGNKVRLIETSAENYWYGFPPFTWILTPVITTVTADYQPSEAMLRKALAEEAEAKAKS